MKAKANFRGQKEDLRSYISHINWDWLFLKGQLIFGSILLFALVCFLVWFS